MVEQETEAFAAARRVNDFLLIRSKVQPMYDPEVIYSINDVELRTSDLQELIRESITSRHEWEEMIHKDYILNANKGMHWADKNEIVRVLYLRGKIAGRKLGKFERVRLMVEVSYPTARKSDAHNLMPTMKPYVDGLVDGGNGILYDDNDRHFSGPHLDWSGEKSGRKDHFLFRFKLEDRGPAK